jgi:hypothetical protein
VYALVGIVEVELCEDAHGWVVLNHLFWVCAASGRIGGDQLKTTMGEKQVGFMLS